MGGLYGKISADEAISYGDDLVMFLKENMDVASLTRCLEQFKSINSSSLSDFNSIQSSLRDYQKKIDECKQKTDEAKSEVADDAELELLQKELEEELEKERLLKDELRVIDKEIGNLDCERVSVEERKKKLKKLEQDKLKEQSMLSMYASVTNTIPNLDDGCIISGHIVDRDKKVVEKFEFNRTEMSELDTCDSIWKMINSR